MFDVLGILIGLTLLAFVLSVVGLVAKFLLGILLIPLHVVAWLLQGAVGLLVAIVVLGVVLPALMGLLPVVLVVGLVVLPLFLVGCFFAWLFGGCVL